MAPQLTTGQLAARLRRMCIAADPDDAERRYRHAVEDRRLVTEATEAGTAHLLGLELPPDRVAGITARITEIANSLRGGGEERTIDQLRADVFLDLLDGNETVVGNGAGRRRRGVVDIHVDLDTLTRLSDAPGELAGYGPVIADIARRVAEQQINVQWRFTATDPTTGQTLLTGTTRRRPTTRQRRLVEARHRTCIFPGCRMPARRCDLDHRIPDAQGGPTLCSHLFPLCRRDHRIRHLSGWNYRPLPNGDILWTSRLGHHYTTSGTPP